MKRLSELMMVCIMAAVMMMSVGCHKDSILPEGVLPGLFSVSPTQQVHFSKGNLQYQASTNTWRFAEQQYSSNSNDLFGWGTGNNPSLSSVNDLDYATFTDWGSNPIVNGGNAPNLWRTLTKEEWQFLIYKRPFKRGYGLINGYFEGLILLPDTWLQPSGCPVFVTGDEFNRYTFSEWKVMELAGAVFLPLTKYNSQSHTANIGPYGEYWSSTPYDEYRANRIYLYDNSHMSVSYTSRHNKCAVRLVH